MKKIIILLVLGVFLFGCPEQPNEETKTVFKEIPWAEIPGECIEFKEDVCGFYGCMTEQCWCKQGPDQILLEGFTSLEREGEVKEYFEEKRDEITGTSQLEVTKVIKSNSVFWTVFVSTENGEQVFTIASDGTIIETVCGV